MSPSSKKYRPKTASSKGFTQGAHAGRKPMSNKKLASPSLSKQQENSRFGKPDKFSPANPKGKSAQGNNQNKNPGQNLSSNNFSHFQHRPFRTNQSAYQSLWRGTPSKNLLARAFESAELELSATQLELVWKYHLCYREFNDTHDLSRLHSFQSIVERHYLDVCLLKKYLPSILPSPILDLGSGPGLPGILIKILYPECEMILGEPRPARVEFLTHTLEKLGLEGISVFPHKVTAASFTTPIKSCITRAFASIANTFPHINSALQEGGYLYFMKGPGLKQEMESVGHAYPGYKTAHVYEYKIPHTSHQRSLAILQRKSSW